MQRHQQILSVAAAMAAVWAGAANAVPPEPDGLMASAPAPSAWQLVEARNHVTGVQGLAAVVFGIAQERGRKRPASLRVECFEGQTNVHIDVDGLGPAPLAVAVRYSLDGGRFVASRQPANADGSGLMLSGDRAVQFVTELYGKAELRLAVVRPLSVPFLVTFAVEGAERSLRPLGERCHWSDGPAISDAGR
jgi:hypothetical protein